MVAKQARCFAQPPRRLVRSSRTRARGVQRIDARLTASQVLQAARAAVFHRVFAGIGCFRDCKRVAYVFDVLTFNGDAGGTRFVLVFRLSTLASASPTNSVGLLNTSQQAWKQSSHQVQGKSARTHCSAQSQRKWNLARASARGRSGRTSEHAIDTHATGVHRNPAGKHTSGSPGQNRQYEHKN